MRLQILYEASAKPFLVASGEDVDLVSTCVKYVRRALLISLHRNSQS